MSETWTDKLAGETANLAISTSKKLQKQTARVDQLADVAGERMRAAAFAAVRDNWAVARLSPRNRRSEKLVAFDARVEELQGRMDELLRETNKARERVPQAEAAHHEALTRWHADGGKGERPKSPVPALEARIHGLEEDYRAHEPLISQVLAEKTSWVEKNRRGLVKDAAASVQERESATERRSTL